MANRSIKAVRASICIGNIKLDCYQMPDGSYRMSQTQVLQIIEIQARRYTQIRDSKEAQSFALKEIELYPITLDNGAKANTIAIEDVPKVWRVCSKLKRGNQEILEALLDACLLEALERRADAAFGVIRSEEERNIRLQARMDGILSRNFWTETIDRYLQNNEVSENYRKHIYSNVSNLVNRAFLNKNAKQIRQELGLKESDAIRDRLDPTLLKNIDSVERLAGLRVINQKVEPYQALKDAISLVVAS
ncbi:MAG: hypothetical protein ACRDBG_04635 [Waterburya sp.]